MSAQQVEVQINVNSNTKGVREAESALGSFGDTLSNVVQIAAGFSLANIGMEIGQLIRDTASFAVTSASNIEQSRITMDAFTGSVQKGQQAMEILNRFARSAPLIPVQDVFQGGQQLLGFGFGLDQLGDKIKLAGELSLAAHTPLSVAVDLLGRAKEGIFNLREFGQFGISAEELEKYGVAFKKVGAGMQIENRNDLMPALEKLAQARFGGIFAAEATTFAGAVQNIKDDLVRLGAGIMGVDENGNVDKNGLFKLLEKDAIDFYNYIDAHKQAIADSLKSALIAVTNFANFLKDPVLKNTAAFFDYVSTHQWVLDALNSLLVAIAIVTAPLIVTAIIGIGAALLALAANPVVLITAALALLIFAIYEVATHFNQITDWMLNVGIPAFQTFAVKSYNAIADWANKIVDAINTVLKAFNSIPGIVRAAVGLPSGSIPLLGHISDLSLPSGGGGGQDLLSYNKTLSGLPSFSGMDLSNYNGYLGGANSGIGGFSPLPATSQATNITNYNTFNTPYDPSNFARQLGQQVSNAQH